MEDTQVDLYFSQEVLELGWKPNEVRQTQNKYLMILWYTTKTWQPE